jgi:hypothetical protein
VAVIGDVQTGKKTFMKSILPPEEQDLLLGESFSTAELSVCDLKNNVQIIFQFQEVELRT